MREAIINSELKYEQCVITFYCYMKMENSLSRNWKEEKKLKILEYEAQHDDAWLVQNTIYVAIELTLKKY